MVTQKRIAVADWDLRGDVLASARQAAGLSQRALATAINMADEDRVGLWERGEARPQARVVPLIAARLGVDTLSLLAGEPDSPDLTRLRVAAGLNLKEMAERVGLPITSYHRLERRGAPQGGLDADTANAIAEALDIAPDSVASLLTRRTRKVL